MAANNTNPQGIADPPAASDLARPSTGDKSHATAAVDHFFAKHAAAAKGDLFSEDIIAALLSLEKKP